MRVRTKRAILESGRCHGQKPGRHDEEPGTKRIEEAKHDEAQKTVVESARREGSDLEKEAAFVAAFRFLKNRITAFISLPLASIDALALASRLREIGRMDGSTVPHPKAG